MISARRNFDEFYLTYLKMIAAIENTAWCVPEAIPNGIESKQSYLL